MVAFFGVLIAGSLSRQLLKKSHHTYIRMRIFQLSDFYDISDDIHSHIDYSQLYSQVSSKLISSFFSSILIADSVCPFVFREDFCVTVIFQGTRRSPLRQISPKSNSDQTPDLDQKIK